MPHNCFVIIGYGKKVDPYTGQHYDLDKTFQSIIKPALKELNIECFRSIDIQQTGVIERTMFKAIQEADIVVADITTLNPNVMYELGVRHVLKPCTTIIIAENNLLQKKLPFDISHLATYPYEHLGTGIDFDEVMRMREQLQNLISFSLSRNENDSPVYTYLPNLSPPKVQVTRSLSPTDNLSKNKDSLADIIEQAESAKQKEDFLLAAKLFREALDRDENDPYLRQRLALVTYQSEVPDAVTALKNALDILQELQAEESIDPETLGLMGAIHKRLFQRLQDEAYLDKAVEYYQRGFIVRNDYYNGINLAFVLDQKSLIQPEPLDAMLYNRQAKKVRLKVTQICDELLTTNEDPNKSWLLLSRAEAKYGLGEPEEANGFLSSADGDFTSFQRRTFRFQIERLDKIQKDYHQKFGKFIITSPDK